MCQRQPAFLREVGDANQYRARNRTRTGFSNLISYSSVDRLIEVLEDKIVRRTEAKFTQLLARRTKQLRIENV
jgi:hypothetical protein